MTFHVIEVPLDDGESVRVEVDAPGGIAQAARPGEVATRAAESFQAALERFEPVTEAIIKRFQNLTERPAEVGVEFGIKLNADAGVVIAHTSGEANFKVTVQWRQL